MTAPNGSVEVRWMPGLGSCPGAVDLTTTGPLGTIERAVTWPEALTLGIVIDLLCPGSNWYETINALPPDHARARRPLP